MSAVIARRSVTFCVTLLLLFIAVALGNAFGMDGRKVMALAMCGALVAGAGAVLCGAFVRTPPDSFEHSIARSSLVALAILPPALALRAAVVGDLALEPADQRLLVIASSVWMVFAGAFTAGVLHLAERYEASQRRTTGHGHAAHPRSA